MTCRLMARILILLAVTAFISGCASWIVEGEHFKTRNDYNGEIKPDHSQIKVFFKDDPPPRKYTKVGKALSRAWAFEKGINELKKQANLLGADAVIDVTFTRKFSVDYLQDLYLINGNAVIWMK